MGKQSSRLLVRHDGPITPSPKEILAKALSAMKAGRISGHEAVRCEVLVNSNRYPDQTTLEKIYGQAEFRKSFTKPDWQRVRSIRRTGPFDDLCRDLAAWQRSQRRSR
jgi:hypothetical protein